MFTAVPVIKYLDEPVTKEGFQDLIDILHDKTTVLAGPGAGKSSLLTALGRIFFTNRSSEQKLGE